MIAIDLYFFCNTILDLILLGTVASMAQKPVLWRRLTAAAVLGGIWSCVSLWLSVSVRQTPLQGAANRCVTYLALPWLMCRIAFGETRRKCAESLVLFYIAGMLLGGCMLLFRYAGLPFANLAGMAAASVLLVFVFRRGKRKIRTQSHIYPAVLVCDTGRMTVKAYLDSGNTLRTQEGQPVHVVSKSIAQRIAAGRQQEEGPQATVRYQTVGETQAQMPVICIRQMILLTEEGNRVIDNPVLALSNVELICIQDCRLLLHCDTLA